MALYSVEKRQEDDGLEGCSAIHFTATRSRPHRTRGRYTGPWTTTIFFSRSYMNIRDTLFALALFSLDTPTHLIRGS